jgi:hypothetical protein
MTDMLSFMVKSAAAQMTNSMASVLKKAADHAKDKGIEESVLLNARLFPDMFPAVRQYQIATDVLGRGAARLAGVDMPSNPDTETSFAELIARCGRVGEYVDGLDSAAMDANADTTLQIPMGPDTVMPMQGKAYVSSFVLPNSHFHAATGYALLRHQGIALTKRDFLMG